MGLARKTLLASAARTTSSDSGLLELTGLSPDKFAACVLLLDVTAASGTTPTLDLFIQEELPDGTFDDVARFAQVTAVGKRVIRWVANSAVEGVLQDAAMAAGNPKSGPLFSRPRLKWLIGGTTPSFTFSVSGDFFN